MEAIKLEPLEESENQSAGWKSPPCDQTEIQKRPLFPIMFPIYKLGKNPEPRTPPSTPVKEAVKANSLPICVGQSDAASGMNPLCESKDFRSPATPDTKEDPSPIAAMRSLTEKSPMFESWNPTFGSDAKLSARDTEKRIDKRSPTSGEVERAFHRGLERMHLQFRSYSAPRIETGRLFQSNVAEPVPLVVNRRDSSQSVLAASSGGVYNHSPLSQLAEGVKQEPNCDRQLEDPSNVDDAPMREARNRRHYNCVLCENCGVYSMRSLSGHQKENHRHGYVMGFYEEAEFEGKTIFAPKNVVENNELASCSTCQKVLFKHRAKFGNHGCVQCRNYQAIKYQQTIDEGQGDEYCLLCQLRCGNVKEHHKIAHNGNTVYKVGEMFGKTCLAPLHLHDENHREELMDDSADGGHHRFAYKFRARRIS